MQNFLKVVSVNISKKKGTVKNPVDEIMLDSNGIIGDAHAGRWHRQVSLLSLESIEFFAKEMNRKIKYGEFAENITIQGIDLTKVSLLDRFKIGDVVLEVTQIGKECHGDQCTIYNEVGQCIMPKEGVFCRVIECGKIKAGDAIQYIPKILTFKIITLSDRAYHGEYEDQSGQRIHSILEEYFKEKNRNIKIEKTLLADDANLLKQELEKTRDTAIDVVFTTGGTGISPRDITPDVALYLCDKTIPSIMEHIRIKYGSQNPNALLSRGIAGVMKETLIFTLPGSVKAVEEYMSEILKILEHAIYMLHGLGH